MPQNLIEKISLIECNEWIDVQTGWKTKYIFCNVDNELIETCWWQLQGNGMKYFNKYGF